MRVGLTGGLGSGKSTVAAMLREDGYQVLEADAIARELMQPGQRVHRAIAEHFGPSVVRADGTLDRARLAAISFGEGRLQELTRIVHPPVIAEQEQRMAKIFARDPAAIVVIESALIFEAEASGTVPEWPRRFDRIILVTAPDETRIRRFLARILPPNVTEEQRAAAERDARCRIAAQLPDSVKIPHCHYIIDNSGSLEDTRRQVDRIAADLRDAVRAQPGAPGRV
ncbi:MAG TPA: dephospho-CoA kinase [Acidobacteriaceae bacterium]|nr:dephospho-CoA kinase [Acidobacteriaceae bacterium]